MKTGLSRLQMHTLLLCLAFGLSGCQRSDESIEPEGPRPVTVVSLETTSPSVKREYTGSLGFWNHENLAFQVSGKVIRVTRSGTQLSGPVRTAEGEFSSLGDEIAAIDPTPYEFQLTAARAKHEAMVGKLEVLKVQTKEVEDKDNDAKIKLAELQVLSDDAIVDYQNGTIGSIERDKAIAARETAEKIVEQTTNGLKLKRAEYRANEATLEEARIGRRKAEFDLKNCVLRAPFSGTVAQVHITTGSLVAPARPAATFVMMDPLKIEIALSAESDGELNIGDAVDIRPANNPDAESEPGWVHARATAANPATRTLGVTLLVRNTLLDSVDVEAGEDVTRIREAVAVQTVDSVGETKFVPEYAMFGNDEKGHFVWKFKDLSKDAYRGQFDPSQELTKIEVTPGDQRLDLPGGIRLRELKDAGSLTKNDLLAVDVPSGQTEDKPVLLLRQRWKFRPGELVNVRFNVESAGAGFYVPMTSIVEAEGELFVFKLDSQSGQSAKASKVKVEAGNQLGSQMGIVSDELKPGDRIVARGAHMLNSGGESVSVIEDILADTTE